MWERIRPQEGILAHYLNNLDLYWLAQELYAIDCVMFRRMKMHKRVLWNHLGLSHNQTQNPKQTPRDGWNPIDNFHRMAGTIWYPSDVPRHGFPSPPPIIYGLLRINICQIKLYWVPSSFAVYVLLSYTWQNTPLNVVLTDTALHDPMGHLQSHIPELGTCRETWNWWKSSW